MMSYALSEGSGYCRAEISVWSPRTLFILHYLKDIFSIKVSKKHAVQTWKQKRCPKVAFKSPCSCALWHEVCSQWSAASLLKSVLKIMFVWKLTSRTVLAAVKWGVDGGPVNVLQKPVDSLILESVHYLPIVLSTFQSMESGSLSFRVYDYLSVRL